MQIKRYAAASMSEALQLVKAELGPEAIILSARSVKKNGLFLDAFRKAGVEVTAAKDAPQTVGNRNSSQNSGQVRQSYLSLDRARVRNAYRQVSDSAADGNEFSGDHGDRQAVRSDKDERLCGSWLYRHLLRQDVRQEFALEIASELLVDSVAQGDRDERLLTALGHALRKVGVDTRPLVSAGARRVALIGPAGAGKTACTAKIAAAHAINTGRKVGMISLDNYRVAATGQLQRCAELIGIPLVAVNQPEELQQAFCRLEGCDLILIDTPALCRTNDRMLAKLTDDLNRAGADDIHFVCSGSRKENDTLELFKSLKGIAVNRLLFTKLDETASYGSLLNLLVQLQVPASGFSSGQRIPSSLEEATVGKLADLILSGKKPAVVDHRFDAVRPARNTAGKGRRKSSPAAFMANKNSYLFHTADCVWTRLIKKDNQVVFTSAAAALARKFKPCRDCCKDIVEPPRLRRRGVNRTTTTGACGTEKVAKGFAKAGRPETIPARSA